VAAKCTLKLFEPGTKGSQFTLTAAPKLKFMAGNRLFVGNLSFPSNEAQVTTFSLQVYLKEPASFVIPLGAKPTAITKDDTYGACFNLNGVTGCSNGKAASQECLIYDFQNTQVWEG
jgi:hypothetical protein